MAAATTVEWLSAAIAQATKSAKFCVSGSFPIVDPSLDVEGLGPIRLPLRPRMAKPLIASCHVAPYGKGAQTLVDREVRNTYELNPEQFRLSETWDAAIADVTRFVAAELGLPPDRLADSAIFPISLLSHSGLNSKNRYVQRGCIDFKTSPTTYLSYLDSVD